MLKASYRPLKQVIKQVTLKANKAEEQVANQIMMKVKRLRKENQENDNTESDIPSSTTKKKEEGYPKSNNSSIDPDNIGDNFVVPATIAANPQELPISRKKNKDLPVTSRSNLMPQSDDITFSSATLLASTAMNPDNLPVNHKEPILKHLPTGGQFCPNLKPLLERTLS